MIAVERTIEIPGLTLAARVHGPDDGLPVLALHGWTDNAATFDRLAPLLPGLRIVALDLAGHGLSGRRVGAPYHFIDYVADVAAAAEALGWQQFSLLGHSLGAGVAALLAGTWPDRVRRLVLLEGLGPMTEPDAGAPARLREALAAEFTQARRGGGPRPGYPDPQVVARRLAEAVQMQQSSAELLLARGLHEVGPGRWDWRADGQLRMPSRLRMTEGQVEAFLRAIACPTLLLRADPGMPVDPAYFAARLAWIADATRVVRPGGHHVHLDDPETVAAVVGPFLLGA
jgi:pimeloyl-ACP methyl ester carboxylesterase